MAVVAAGVALRAAAVDEGLGQAKQTNLDLEFEVAPEVPKTIN
mgnify:CR=1 FL=1